jgi:hypothetical protein
MRKLVILCLSVVLLSSCIGIDSRLTIRDNGSGILQLTYRISQLVADLGVSSTGKSDIPLPVSRADFERSLSASSGKVRLSSFSKSEDEKDVTVRVEIAFDSLDALAKVDAFRDAELKAGADGSARTFSQVVARTPAQPLSEDSKRMLHALFDGYDLSFVVIAPQPITDAPLGTLSADKKTLSYKTTINDVMTTTQDLVMSVRW